MRISDWSSDVCSSDLSRPGGETVKFLRTTFLQYRVFRERRRPAIFMASKPPAAWTFLESVSMEQTQPLFALTRPAHVGTVKLIVNDLAVVSSYSRAVVGLRSDERRVGKGCGRPCRARGCADH